MRAEAADESKNRLIADLRRRVEDLEQTVEAQERTSKALRKDLAAIRRENALLQELETGITDTLQAIKDNRLKRFKEKGKK